MGIIKLVKIHEFKKNEIHKICILSLCGCVPSQNLKRCAASASERPNFYLQLVHFYTLILKFV